MPHGNISVNDLRYLREQSVDRDRWAGTPVLYWMVNESTSAFDRRTKETENFGYHEHIKLNGFLTVRAPGQPFSSRPTGEQAPGPEHEVDIVFGYEQLVRAQVTPKAKDILRISGVFYIVQLVQKDLFIKDSPFNLNVALKLKRLEQVPQNLDLPFDDEPGLASMV